MQPAQSPTLCRLELKDAISLAVQTGMSAALSALVFWGAANANVRVITPIGPFCPIKSAFCREGSPVSLEMSKIAGVGQDLAMKMARIQLSAQMGQQVDVSSFRELADQLDAAVQSWKVSQDLMRSNLDFQTVEFHLMTSCHVERSGFSMDEMYEQLLWQVQAMRATADGRPPPPKPPGGLRQSVFNSGFKWAQSPPLISAEPFRNGGSEVFGSELIQDEYESIFKEHRNLIQLGERFGAFDPRGRLSFIDALEAVEARWDVFFSRISLMDAINPQFVEQTEEYIRAMGLEGTADLRALLKEAHDRMREQARKEI